MSPAPAFRTSVPCPCCRAPVGARCAFSCPLAVARSTWCAALGLRAEDVSFGELAPWAPDETTGVERRRLANGEPVIGVTAVFGAPGSYRWRVYRSGPVGLPEPIAAAREHAEQGAVRLGFTLAAVP